MKSPWRQVFGFACFVPALGVLGLAAWSMVHPELQDALARVDLGTLRAIPRATVIQGGALLGAIVIAQFALAAIAALHLEKRTDVTGTAKIMWPVAVLFVASVAAPLFFFKKVRAATPTPAVSEST